MSARSPFDLLGFADFGQLLQDYQRKRNGGAPVDASINDAHGRAAAEAWRAVQECGRRYGIAEEQLAVLR